MRAARRSLYLKPTRRFQFKKAKTVTVGACLALRDDTHLAQRHRRRAWGTNSSPADQRSGNIAAAAHASALALQRTVTTAAADTKQRLRDV